MGKFIGTIAAIIIILSLLIIGGTYTLVGVGINAVVDEADNTKELKEELIGSKTIVNSDTLIITEFTWHDKSVSGYLTSDKELNKKITISVEFAKKNLIENERN